VIRYKLGVVVVVETESVNVVEGCILVVEGCILVVAGNMPEIGAVVKDQMGKAAVGIVYGRAMVRSWEVLLRWLAEMVPR